MRTANLAMIADCLVNAEYVGNGRMALADIELVKCSIKASCNNIFGC